MAFVLSTTGAVPGNHGNVGRSINCKKVLWATGCFNHRRRFRFGSGLHIWNTERNRKVGLWAQTVEEEGVTDVGGVEKLDWNKAWYPVRLLEDLEPKKPTAVELLGRQFVLWRDKNEEWRCFRNVCPHRLARLSEGRIEASDGTLVCSYHGWRFDEEGSCKLIPQQENPPPGGLSGRSSVMSFPVKVQALTVWIWPDESESAFIDSAMVDPNGIEYFNEDVYGAISMYTRKVPFPVDILLENVLDPSRLAHAHHGILGNRDKEGWMKGESQKPDNKSAFKVTFESLKNADEPSEKPKIIMYDAEFFPPNFVHVGLRPKGLPNSIARIAVYAVPTSSTSSRFFALSHASKRPIPWYGRLMRKLTRPVWARHLTTHPVLDGANLLLAEQGNMLRSTENVGIPWESQYCIPSTADLGVKLFRRWFHNGGGGGGPKLPDGQSLLQGNYVLPSRADLLDRYESHTKGCRACSNALWWVRFGKVAAQALSCVLGALGLMTAIQAQTDVVQRIVSCLGVFASSLAAAGVAHRLLKLEKAFIFRDYEYWKT